MRISSIVDLATPRTSDPSLALATDRRLDPLALCLRFFVGANHYQQAIDEIHRLAFQAFAVVFPTVAGRDDGNTGIDNLGELRLRLDGFGPTEAVQTFDYQYGTNRYLPVFDGAQENAKRPLFHVPLVKCR